MRLTRIRDREEGAAVAVMQETTKSECLECWIVIPCSYTPGDAAAPGRGRRGAGERSCPGAHGLLGCYAKDEAKLYPHDQY